MAKISDEWMKYNFQAARSIFLLSRYLILYEVRRKTSLYTGQRMLLRIRRSKHRSSEISIFLVDRFKYFYTCALKSFECHEALFIVF